MALDILLAGAAIAIVIAVIRLALQIRKHDKPIMPAQQEPYRWDPDVDLEKLREHRRAVSPSGSLLKKAYDQPAHYQPPPKSEPESAVRQNDR